MALNWKMFRTRAITAILFVIIMLGGLLINKWSFLLLFSILHFGCWFEYQKLVGLIDSRYKTINLFHKYGIVLVGYGLMLFFTDNWFVTETISLHSIGWILGLVSLLVIPIAEVLFSEQFNFKNLSHSLFGLLYISLSFALMVHIRSGALWMPVNGDGAFNQLTAILATISGYTIPLIIIGSIWINDTMAYIAGSLIGKTPLSSVSPKKTWEGTLGGILLSVIILWLIGRWSQSSAAWLWACIAAIASVSGTFGDLLESKLKRLAGVKDSGSFMPGHGGFLDRFDSLLLAIPIVWLFLKIIT